MNKFKIGDLVMQKDCYYSFLKNNKPYEVTHVMHDGFMYVSSVSVPVWQPDFTLVEKPDES